MARSQGLQVQLHALHLLGPRPVQIPNGDADGRTAACRSMRLCPLLADASKAAQQLRVGKASGQHHMQHGQVVAPTF
jgi:hypothetical protein